nr:hypothetical protein [Methanobacterium formicicum]
MIKEGVGGQSFKVVPEGIETHNGLFIKFTDIISVEDVSKPRTVEKKIWNSWFNLLWPVSPQLNTPDFKTPLF